ncbi:hypothetical protein BDN71DRAFT_495395 [Pleurotus eryngii]|uniref:Uncharacterized protein n=1 Tax=Pleurotus eryngii TaxID=5323 RepID=A0A9P6ABP4_PLEER|nr:hypothetical protein BDN71DRAFT_495395 [Pleurotus eryngii]
MNKNPNLLATPLNLIPHPYQNSYLKQPSHSLLSRIYQIAMAPFTHLIFLVIAFGGFTQVLAKPVSTDSDALAERDDGPLEVCRTINCVTGNSEPPTEDFRICCSGGHTTASDPDSDSSSTSPGDAPDSSNGLIVTTGHLSNTETDGSVGDEPGSPLTQITATYDEAQSEPAGAGVQLGDVQLVAIGPQDTSNGAAGERVVITRPQGLNLLGPTQATPSGASGGDPPTSGSNGGNLENGSDGGSGGANGDAGNTGSPSTSGANGGNQGTGSGGTAASAGNAGNSSNPPPSGAGSPNAGAGADNQGNDNQGTNGNGSGSGTGSGSGQQANGSGGRAASGQGSNPPANGGGSGSPLICNCVCG